MKKIESFNKPQIVQLRSSIDKALDQVAKEYGITISAGNCSFSGNEANFKLKLNTIGEGGTVITKEMKAWDLYANLANGPLEGLQHLSIGDTIKIQGNSYTLSGYNTRARKAPINFTDSRGNGYKCSVRMLANENSK
jgi:hypothetical protein